MDMNAQRVGSFSRYQSLTLYPFVLMCVCFQTTPVHRVLSCGFLALFVFASIASKRMQGYLLRS